MSKAAIIAELPSLSVEELADVRASLDQLTGDAADPKSSTSGTMPFHLRTPRLADRTLASDFVKRVTELATHAEL